MFICSYDVVSLSSFCVLLCHLHVIIEHCVCMSVPLQQYRCMFHRKILKLEHRPRPPTHNCRHKLWRDRGGMGRWVLNHFVLMLSHVFARAQQPMPTVLCASSHYLPSPPPRFPPHFIRHPEIATLKTCACSSPPRPPPY
jgi:hypothetical protein